MSKKDLLKDVAAGAGVTMEAAGKVLRSLSGAVAARLAAGETVKLAGLAIFNVKAYGARPGRNPKTGVEVEVPAAERIRIKPVKALEDAVEVVRQA